MRARAAALASVVGIVAGATGCPGGAGDGEVVGENGVVAFRAETPLAFTTRLVVGSSFAVDFHAVDPKDAKTVNAGALQSSNEKVFAFKDGKLVAVGPGTANLVLQGKKGPIDSIALHAGKAGATTLVDGALLAASSALDARLPASFAFTTDDEHTLQVAAVDQCGGEMVDLHASTLASTGTVPAAVSEVGPATFSMKTQEVGDVELTLKTPGLPDLPYELKSVDSSAVDEVQVAPVSVDDQNNVTLWGRAFENDVEVIGDLNFKWVADERVSLAAPAGLVVTANVAVPGPNEPPDDRPATVTAEVFGEAGTLDLLQLGGQAAVSSRGTPARVLPDDTTSGGYPGGGGCGGTGGCDPEAALFGLFGLPGLRGLRRRLAAVRGLGRG